MVNQNRRVFLAFLGILYITVMISLYYVWHKPITSAEVIRFVRALVQIAAALGIVATGGGLGKRLIWKDQSGLEHLAAQAALGCGILAIVVLPIGAWFGLNRPLAWILLFSLVVFLRREVRGWWNSLWEFRSIWLESPGWGRWIGAGLALTMLTTLLTALAPPLKFDALVYHLALPRYFQFVGKIEYTPWLIYWGMPQTGEMLYTLATMMAGVQAATTLGWMLGGLAILGILGYLHHRLGSSAAWAGVAAITSGLTLSSSLAWAYVDWMVILFGVCTLVSLERYEASGEKRELILAGTFAGMALGTKYTAGVILLAGIILITWHFIQRRESSRVGLTNLAQFILPAVAVTLPWWIKNILATGNSFYPFFLPAGAVDKFRLDFYHIPVWGDWRDVVLLPMMASLTGVEGAPGYSASIGPLMLALSMCALLGWKSWGEKERLTVHIATVVSLAGIIIWAVASRLSGYLIQSRLYAVVFPAFAVLAGAGFKAISLAHGSGIRLGRVAATLILLVYGLGVFEVVRSGVKQDVPQNLFGIISSDEYLAENLGWYATAMQAIKKLPEDSRVLMLWEPRSLYCMPNCVPDEVIDRWKHDLFTLNEPGVILQDWGARGYTHLLYYRLGADFVRQEDSRYSPSDWQSLETLLAGLPKISEFGEAYILYSLQP